MKEIKKDTNFDVIFHPLLYSERIGEALLEGLEIETGVDDLQRK